MHLNLPNNLVSSQHQTYLDISIDIAMSAVRRSRAVQLSEALDEIRTKPVVPVWPHLALIFGCSRGQCYAMINRNEVEFIRIGKSIKVVTAPLRKQLGLDGLA